MTGADRQILVIGGAGSIGGAIAEAAAQVGASVWIADARDASSVARALPGSGHRAVHTDVTDPASVAELISMSWAEGGPDGVVYSPGLLHAGDVADISASDIERLFEVSLTGAFTVGAAIARHVRAAPRATNMVFISSVAGLRGEAGGALYCATKFGLIGFVQSFAAEIAAYGCRANVVCPGNVDTPMLRSLASRLAERNGTAPEVTLGQLADSTAFRRLVAPAEVASPCLWLLSPHSSGVSGQTIVVDGPTRRA